MKRPAYLTARTIATLILGVAVTASAFLPHTAPVARASGAPVFDVANFITNTVQTAIVQTLNGVAWAVAKTARDALTRSMVNWINSGYEGEPAFVQNLNQDLRQVADGASTLFLRNLRISIKENGVNSPFAADMAQMSVNAYLLATSEDRLAQRLRYTLLDHTQKSVNYMRGPDSFGGLSAWHSRVFECGNDPACVQFSTEQELISQIDAEARKFLTDFNNGRGFLSWRGECQKYEQAASANATNMAACDGTVTDCSEVYQNERVALNDEDKCLAHDVLTPGSVVEEQLVQMVGSPIRELELADSVNEIVGAAITQMVGQVLGPGGLFGVSKPKASGAPRTINQATNPANNAIASSGFSSIAASERERTVSFKAAWTDIQTLAVEARSSCTVAGGVVSIARMGNIERAVNQAASAIARADRAIASLDEVLSLLTPTDTETLFSAADATSSQRAWEKYQALLSGNGLITAQDQADAAIARSESPGSDSLYLEMKAYVDACD